MHIDPANYLPVIYKTEIELSSLSGILPTLLIIGRYCLIMSGYLPTYLTQGYTHTVFKSSVEIYFGLLY
jgi:hypothetical protein